MSSLVQRRDRKVKEGFSKKLPAWAIGLILLAVAGILFFLLSADGYRMNKN